MRLRLQDDALYHAHQYNGQNGVLEFLSGPLHHVQDGERRLEEKRECGLLLLERKTHFQLLEGILEEKF